ncbi:pentapeptide repeat-containing protein [Maridesulfovibrio sp.]|uniref:pentapeptide repeat-containing protein n=1 Tax=Maridesulfovibrio sp. TaxID=2795000 RepID=UPI002AA84B3F|nr:pentapeptide repeat-containing protein [Maridesulfovibrio sp.]
MRGTKQAQKILLQGVNTWNKWRTENNETQNSHTKITPHSLKKARLQRAELDNANLKKANLSEAKLHEAKLRKATLRWADLSKADLRGATLNGADLRKANLSYANLRGANLQNADLRGANLENTNLERSDLRGTKLNYASMKESIVHGVKFDNTMQCRGVNIQNGKGSQRFVRHVLDLDYIEETKEKHPKFYWWWKITSDCGRSFERWALWSIGFALSFGIAFANYPVWSWLPDWMKTFLTYISPAFSYSNPGIQDGWFTPYYFSIVTFTTLGFGDVTPTNTAGQLWLTAEVTLGYIMLGGLITLFANKMVRQSG